ncbi:hypothetical protein CCP1ISM_3700001 [Azospirillaceae bacterium]
MFSVELPLATATDPPVSQPQPQPPATIEVQPTAAVSRQRSRILLVEDDALQSRGLSLVLEKAGFEIAAYTTPTQALSSLQLPGPDLVLSDYRLPEGFSGLDLIRQLRQRLNRFVPALLITGDTQADIVQQAARETCAVIHKPCRPDALIAAIHHSLAPPSHPPPQPAQLQPARSDR